MTTTMLDKPARAETSHAPAMHRSADYLIPVNADIDQLDVILVPEVDQEVNRLDIKGIGELANVGTAAAVANAVYHATGIRVRELPIRLEKLLPA